MYSDEKTTNECDVKQQPSLVRGNIVLGAFSFQLLLLIPSFFLHFFFLLLPPCRRNADHPGSPSRLFSNILPRYSTCLPFYREDNAALFSPRRVELCTNSNNAEGHSDED